MVRRMPAGQDHTARTSHYPYSGFWAGQHECRYGEFLIGTSLHAETHEVPVSCWCRSVEILKRVEVATHGRKSRQIARADVRDQQPILISLALSITYGLAERVGFEPTVEFPLHTLSKRAPSTTRTSLRSSGSTVYSDWKTTSNPIVKQL